jgi:hypothetical protein
MNSDLLTRPHILNESMSWFELPKGILIVIRSHNYTDPGYVYVHEALIPWEEIRAALKRKDKDTMDE